MDNDIYRPPSSDLSDPAQLGSAKRNQIRSSLAAFFLAPLITSIFGIVVFIGAETFNSYTNQNISGINISEAGEVFVFLLAVYYLLLLVPGIPIHWLFGKIKNRKPYFYLLAGILISVPFPVFTDATNEPFIWFFVLMSGIICSGSFWFIAVYPGKTKSPNKLMQSDAMPATRALRR
jgi:hypothetical protein